MTLLNTIIGIIFFLLGAIVQSVYSVWESKRKREELKIEKEEEIEFKKIDIDYLKEEWKTTIETQMHFNDLIIKFRSIVLSVFITGLGIAFSFSDKFSATADLYFLLTLALAFWICCFLLDYFYYQKLLLGAVRHANKFDNNDISKEKGYLD